MTHFPKTILIVLWLGMTAVCGSGFAQDTIFLKGDTIRVGELEWDIEKDWRSNHDLLASNTDLYGEHVRIKLIYHPNKMVQQMMFGYISEDSGFVPHGPARYYYDQGQLLGKRYFLNGVLNGPAMDFYPGGALKVKGRYLDDLLDGTYSTFFENGQTEMTAYYREGNPDGVHRAWYSNGVRKWVETYSSGARTGPDSSFYETGALEATAIYQDGLPHGSWKFYHRNGAPWTERVFENGLLVDVPFLKSKEGRPLEIGGFSQGKGWLILYSDDGIPVERELYKNGRLKRTKLLK